MSYCQVTQFRGRLRGGSQPMLVAAEDGLLYVAKFAENPQGPNLLFNESMGAELYRACGLNVPEWKPLWLSQRFLDRHPNCRAEAGAGVSRPAAGLCFGSRYLRCGEAQVYEILPASAFVRICNRADFWLAWLVDVCAGHTDNRQALYVEDAGRQLLAYFIDHGHCFGGADARGDGSIAMAASRYLDARMYAPLSGCDAQQLLQSLQQLDAQTVWRRLSAVAPEWQSPSAWRSLERTLVRLGNRPLLEALLHRMAASLPQDAQRGSFLQNEGQAYVSRGVVPCGFPEPLRWQAAMRMSARGQEPVRAGATAVGLCVERQRRILRG